MTQVNRHRIQRQVVELSLAGDVADAAIHESLARTFHADMVPELEAAFNRAAGPHELLRLDRLEIDLGTIATRDWLPEMRRRLGTELAQRLERFTPESRAQDGPDARSDAESNEPLRQFLFYLAHGRIPWWGQRPAAGWSASLPGAVLDSSVLRAALQAEPRARMRFIDSLDDAMLELAVARWCGVSHATQVLAWLARQAAGLPAHRHRRGAVSRLVDAARGPGTAPVRDELQRGFWSRLIAAALDSGALPARGPALLRELLDEWLGADADRTPAALHTGGAHAGAEAGAPSNEVPTVLPSPWREWLPAAQQPMPAVPGANEAGHDRAGAGQAAAAGRMTPPATHLHRSSPAPEDEESIYLPGAGAVLLHPFLEPLFRDRALLAGRDFRDAAARERAVHLVGLLSFGRHEVAEYDLVAAKLLCGHPLDQPIAPVMLEDADAAACDELLTAVLRHWSVLRSSSAQWLRDQFFLRDGKLEVVDEGFRLTVERHAQDVLLARLPWGFGVIGLPWMKEKIFVRWLD